MTMKQIVKAWNSFFFDPMDGHAMALLRIYTGILLLSLIVSTWHSFLLWVGPDGMISLQTVSSFTAPWKYQLIKLVTGPTRSTVYFIFFALSSVSLMVGWHTRISTIAAFVCYTVLRIHHYSGIGGPDVFNAILLGILFSDSAAVWSLDAVRKKYPSDRKISSWGPRVLQLYTTLAYISCFAEKSESSNWYLGNAFHYIVNSIYWSGPHIQAFEAHHPAVSLLFSWSTVLVELSLGTLIWIREFRYIVLAIGLVFHLTMAFTMLIPGFQWWMIGFMILFIDDKDIVSVKNWIWRNLGPAKKRLGLARFKYEQAS